MKRGIIEIENMEFYGHHGCFTEERTIGNPFIVTLRLEVDMEMAIHSDCLADAVNYQKAFAIVQRELAIPSNLLEHVANRVLTALYAELKGILEASVKISKINPPMGGQIKSVSVNLTM